MVFRAAKDAVKLAALTDAKPQREQVSPGLKLKRRGLKTATWLVARTAGKVTAPASPDPSSFHEGKVDESSIFT